VIYAAVGGRSEQDVAHEVAAVADDDELVAVVVGEELVSRSLGFLDRAERPA
jgi:hypothetical protein